MSDIDQEFEGLYNANRDDLFAFLIRSVREENTALDLLQDVFLNFFNAFRTRELPPEVECRMYLFRIARNLLINNASRAYSRKVQLVGEYVGNETSVTGTTRVTGNLEDSIIRKLELEQAEERLRVLLLELDEDQRTAVLLRHSLDMKLEGIAEILGVSVSTASRLVHRAERNLAALDRQKAGRTQGEL